MRAVLTGPGALRFTSEEAPPVAPGWARVAVSLAGICGTDLAIYSGSYPVPMPLVLGHEWCGRVVDVGRAADEAWLGARVVGEINNHCAATLRGARCPLCEASLERHCAERTVTGIVAANGAFQRHLDVPVALLHRVPEGLSDAAAVFVEPFAAALQTFELSPVEPGALVVVLGSGRLGALIAAAALSRGARVLAVSRSGRRDTLLEGLGAETLRHDLSARVEPTAPLEPAPSALLDAVMERTRGRGAPLVVEATGHAAGLAAALDVVRPRGTIALKSTPGAPIERVNGTRLVVNEVRVQGSRCGPFDVALRALEGGVLPVEALIGARFSLTDLEDALEAAPEHLKVLVEVSPPSTPPPASS